MDLYIVTGHTRGLGQALVAQLGAEPDIDLVALGRAKDGPIPGGAQLFVDLADSRAVEAAFDRVEERLRGRRFAKAVLVNNAGVISPVGMVDRIDAIDLERALAVNFTAPILLMRRFLIATATCRETAARDQHLIRRGPPPHLRLGRLLRGQGRHRHGLAGGRTRGADGAHRRAGREPRPRASSTRPCRAWCEARPPRSSSTSSASAR